MTAGDPLQSFRNLVLGDAALQSRLAAIHDPEGFAAAAVEIAAANGIDLAGSEGGLKQAPDPLGIGRLSPVEPSASWAPQGWLPVAILPTAEGAAVDWAHFGGERLDRSFFGLSAREAITRPFNRLFRWQTPIADFVGNAEAAAPPRGLIFHWSRCGSTLVSTMLARLADSASISEAVPLDAALKIGDPALLRAMAAALARGAERSFIKLHCWHAMQIPLYRMAFPDTPWLFLHRDPVEILASHQVAPSPEMMPEILPPAIFGLEEQSANGGDYQARVLARIAEAAIAALHAGGGISVDFQSLPEAVFTTILPQFRESARPEERRAMEHATSDHAKHPGRRFEADSASKAESLGGTRVMGPETIMGRMVLGQFRDPEGNVIGLIEGAS